MISLKWNQHECTPVGRATQYALQHLLACTVNSATAITDILLSAGLEIARACWHSTTANIRMPMRIVRLVRLPEQQQPCVLVEPFKHQLMQS
jgi:hypothetical protein